MEDACEVQPLLQGALTGRTVHGRSSAGTFDARSTCPFGFALFSVEVTLCVQISSPFARAAARVRPVGPSSMVNEELA